LIISVKSGNKSSVEKLLKSGINVYQQDNMGNTSLHYAIELNDLEIIKILISNHADMNIKNNEGFSSLDRANEIGDKKILYTL
ncbi:ankyrin, partial [Anaeromyces robustus]